MGRDGRQRPAKARVAVPPVAPSAPRPLRRQNRLLALLLAGAALFAFATVVSLALLLHYAEAHDLLANL